MPNPAVLHTRSIKIDHHLKIVDFYIHAGMPKVFQVEPNWKKYKPDVYMKDLKGNPICVEVQITPISTKKMQTKIDEFVSSYGKEHDAKVMLLVSNQEYSKIKVPTTFKLIRIPMPIEPYTQ
jgi:hypothetical protein